MIQAINYIFNRNDFDPEPFVPSGAAASAPASRLPPVPASPTPTTHVKLPRPRRAIRNVARPTDMLRAKLMVARLKEMAGFDEAAVVFVRASVLRALQPQRKSDLDPVIKAASAILGDAHDTIDTVNARLEGPERPRYIPEDLLPARRQELAALSSAVAVAEVNMGLQAIDPDPDPAALHLYHLAAFVWSCAEGFERHHPCVDEPVYETLVVETKKLAREAAVRAYVAIHPGATLPVKFAQAAPWAPLVRALLAKRLVLQTYDKRLCHYMATQWETAAYERMQRPIDLAAD